MPTPHHLPYWPRSTPDCLRMAISRWHSHVSCVQGGPFGQPRRFATFSVFPNRRATAQAGSDQANSPLDSPAAASRRLSSSLTLTQPYPTVQGTFSNASTESIIKNPRHASRVVFRSWSEEAEAEGYAFNPDSEVAFRWFLNRYELLKAGRLFLMDNGNLRATWKDERDTHVGLQFLPGDSVQYVIFTRRPSSRTISRVHGYDTLDGIPRLLAAYDLGATFSAT